MKKTRILHIITTLALGGAQKNALYIIANLNPEKFEKYFISAPTGSMHDDVVAQNETINFQFLKCLKRRISPIQDIFAFFCLVRYIKQNKISIVHTHSSKAGILGRWAAKYAKVPIIIHTIHGWSFHEYMSKPVKALYVYLERLTAKITTRFIAVSESDINKGLANKIGTDKQYVLIRYGVEIDIFDKAAKQHPGQDKAAVGMIACLKPQKKPLDFLRMAEIVAAKHPKARFILVGDGILRTEIERFIETHDLQEQVVLLGWRRDIPELLAAMDIVVLTSLWEGLPIALLEAMAAGKPIVAYDTDGINEVILNNENGYLLKPGDVSGLAEKVSGLLTDQKKIKAMGDRGRRLLCSSPHRGSVMCDSLERLYTGLLMAKT